MEADVLGRMSEGQVISPVRLYWPDLFLRVVPQVLRAHAHTIQSYRRKHHTQWRIPPGGAELRVTSEFFSKSRCGQLSARSGLSPRRYVGRNCRSWLHSWTFSAEPIPTKLLTSLARLCDNRPKTKVESDRRTRWGRGRNQQRSRKAVTSRGLSVDGAKPGAFGDAVRPWVFYARSIRKINPREQ